MHRRIKPQMTDDEKIVQRFSSYLCLVDRENSYRTVPSQACDPISKFLIEELTQEQIEPGTIDSWARLFLQNCLSHLEHFNFVWKVDESNIHIFNQCISIRSCNRFVFLYLQLVCWETAVHLSNKLEQCSNRSIGLSVEDYFLIACEASLDFRSLLRSFNFDTPTSLHTFSRIVIQRKVRNQIVRRLKNKTLKFTGYGLLKNTGPNVLEKALLDYGISPREIYSYKLAYQVFKEYFSQSFTAETKTARSHTDKILITSQSISVIEKRFNLQVERLSGTVSYANDLKIKTYLETCMKAVQNSQSPKIVSLDRVIQDSGDIPASSESYLVSENEYLEDGQNEARDIVLAAFNALEPLAQSSLVLWLGLNINQSDFLKVLAVKKQFQVTRQFQRYQREMLRSIVHSSFDDISKQITSNLNALCKEKSSLVKDYLKVYSRQRLSDQAEYSLIHYLDTQDRDELRQWFLTLDIDAVGVKYERKIELESIPILIKFEERFKKTIEEMMPYRLDQLNSANIRVRVFLIDWLANNQAIL